MGKASLAVVVLVAMLCAEQAYAQTWQSLIPGVVQKIISLWSSGEIEFLGHNCRYRQRPSIRRFRLYWKANFSCPSLGNVTGYCRKKSRSKVLNCAIEDFLNDAIKRGLVTQEEAATWLGQQSG